ncbi:MAG: penicillin-binding protein 2 [Patescibacteria group bacterium]
MKNYKISIDLDNLQPEESLLESVSPDSRINKSIDSGFFLFFYFLTALVLGIFAVSGFNLGVVKGSYFAGLSVKNQFVSIPVFSQRGFIYSKEGEILASNIESLNLWLLPSKLKDGKKEELILKLSAILGITEDSISKLIKDNSGKSFFLVKGGLSEKEKEGLSSLQEPSIVIGKSNLRIYPEGEIFSHLVGYVSLVNEGDLNKDSFYKINDVIGRSGLESFYETRLRGQRNEILIHRFKDEKSFSEPQKGASIILNIDYDLQRDLYYELDKALRESGARSGVAVAMDPQDGRVLSLISLPSFNNNAFAGGLNQKEYEALFNNKREPLLNRAISGRFAPGSTLKPIIALGALEEKVITPSKKINAPGFITIKNPYNPDIIYTFRDWKDHGWVNMREAIAYSSDIYFYTVGGGFYDVEGLGIQKIAEYFKKFKLDSILGIDLKGEEAGFIPTPEWKRQARNEIWYQGDTFNVSIGQGDVLATPLWLNNYIAAIGNGHNMYRPFIAEKVLDVSGGVIEVFQPQVIQEFSFNEDSLKVVREGMKMAAEVGTARVLKDLPFDVGAKSGTAEVIKGRSTNSWISVFAPYDNPQIALTIMMESGREGSYIPHQIAYRVLKKYFEIP